MIIKTTSKTYDLTKRTHIMGILNVTPDSFSDGGHYTGLESAVSQAIKMEKQGADIIDIGGESTRPKHDSISMQEELNRVLPIIQAVKQAVNIPISIDTYKAEVASQAIEAGADMINDIWGAQKDSKMAGVVAKHGVPIILMHNRTNKNYKNLIKDMKHDLQKNIDIVLDAGVTHEQIILDPGVGFAKTMEDNYTVMRHLEAFVGLGYPLLLGTSRKSFIQKVLDLPAEDRDTATGATTCLGITKGAHIVRVHNVQLHVELAKMTDAMLKGVGLDG